MGDDFAHVACFKDIVHAHHAVVDLGTHVMVADIGVNGISKINGGGPLGQGLYVRLRRKDKDLLQVDIGLKSL